MHQAALPIDSSTELRQGQSLLAALPTEVVPAPKPLPPGSRVGYGACPTFAGDEQLLTLAALLKPEPRVVVLTGAAGAGKSCLASEFAHRYGSFFAGGVFLMHCGDPESIGDQILACGLSAGILEAPGEHNLDKLTRIERVCQAWERDLPRLLIFDGCDDQPALSAEQLLARWRPTRGQCRVIVTSQHSGWATLHGALVEHPLDGLAPAASRNLLRHYRPDMSLAAINALANTLDHQPLALHLAGSYLRAHSAALSPATYLDTLHAIQSGPEGPFAEPGQPQEQPALGVPAVQRAAPSAEATLLVSFRRLMSGDELDRLALAYLLRAALLLPGAPFPEQLLADDPPAEPAPLGSPAAPIQRLIDLGLLARYPGLETGEPGLVLHPLVGSCALRTPQTVQRRDEELRRVEQALAAAAGAVNQAARPLAMLPLLAHLRFALERAWGRKDLRAARLRQQLGRYEFHQGALRQARTHLNYALGVYNSLLAGEDALIAACLADLAYVDVAERKFVAAQTRFEQAAESFKAQAEAYEREHLEVLDQLAAIALLQGHGAQALVYYQVVLGSTLHTSGDASSPEVARCLNNLGVVYCALANYTQARHLLLQALRAVEPLSQAEPVLTGRILHNLAVVGLRSGSPEEGHSFAARALDVASAAVGPLHPSVAKTRTILAELAYALGAHAVGDEHLDAALAGFGRLYPAFAAIVQAQLTPFQIYQSSFAPAPELAARHALGRIATASELHTELAAALNRRGRLHFERAEFDAAIGSYTLAHTIAQLAAGVAHAESAAFLQQVGWCLAGQQRWFPAYKLLSRAQELYLLHPEQHQAELQASARIIDEQLRQPIVELLLPLVLPAAMGAHADAEAQAHVEAALARVEGSAGWLLARTRHIWMTPGSGGVSAETEHDDELTGTWEIAVRLHVALMPHEAARVQAHYPAEGAVALRVARFIWEFKRAAATMLHDTAARAGSRRAELGKRFAAYHGHLQTLAEDGPSPYLLLVYEGAAAEIRAIEAAVQPLLV